MDETHDQVTGQVTGQGHKKAWDLRGFSRSESGLRAGQLLVGGAAIGLVFWFLQFSTQSICCGDFDGYYHIKWSRLLWE